MNAEEVKVPNVEGHWQSIEIFLFSNGQQYTPPRKYHLRAEELNVWEDTLTLLAQSQYGLQSPLINLYTTDGQLVEGPLELKDGLAYVAVTPPDTFINAGYQKYLIRASRSWEKRQARKKIPECVTEDLCCVCLVKEGCCDLQKCCLCPEKEDEDAVESLYCATGHPELRPAGGHFMSSAPSKPSRADNYRPRSGKIASAADEHAVRPVKFGASPGEFGYSPVEPSVKLDPSGARLVEYGANPSEFDLTLSENGSRLGEFKARLDESGAIPSEFGPRPAENGPRLSKDGVSLREFGTKPDKNAAIPVEYETKPSVYKAESAEYRAKPGEYKTRPSINGAKSSEYGVKLGEYETVPTANVANPSEYNARPDENETKSSINGDNLNKYSAKPAEYETKLGVNRAKPSEYETRPGEYESGLTVHGAKPSEYKARSGINRAKSSEYKDKTGENGAKPSDYKAKPGKNEASPSVNGTKSGDYGARPTNNGAKSDKYAARPGKYETKPSVNGAKHSVNEGTQSLNIAKPSEYETRPDEYENRPSVNGARPGEHKARPGENETRQSINRAKPSEYGATPAEYEARSGEYETVPTVNRGQPIEYKARPGINEAKSSEYNPRPGENGAKSSEYQAKLDENETRPSVNGDKSGDYGAIPTNNGAKSDKYAARPGKYETKPSVNDARHSVNENTQSLNIAKPSEYGAKTGEYESAVIENGAKRNEIEARPGEYETGLTVKGARLSEYKARPGENGDKSSEYKDKTGENRAKPSDYKAKPGKNEASPTVNGAKSGDYGARPSINGPKPDEYRDKPSIYETKLGVNGARHSINEGSQISNTAKSSEYGARPGEYKTRLSVNGAEPSEYRVRPGVNKTGRSVEEAEPSENGARMGEYQTEPRKNGAKPDEYDTRPTIKGAIPNENRATPGEFASTEQDTRLDGYGPRPAKGGACSDEDGVRTTVDKARPGKDGPWSNEIESKKEAYEIELHDNERSSDDNIDRLDNDTVDKDAGEEFQFRKQSSTLSPIGESELEKKGEYVVTESDQKDKQIDPKGRASGNKGRGSARRVSADEQSGRENDTVNGISERKTIEIENARRLSELRPSGNEKKRRPSQQRGEIEHTRRLSRQAGAEIEQGSRTAELTKEFEYGDKVSEPKDRETNLAGRDGLNAALTEQRNKPSNHLARLGGRETRVGDHEARAGDLRLRTSNHDVGLVHPGSAVADTGARAAVSASRASPRDKMGSIARTSNLGQPKIAAKLGGTEIKNRVGYPGARQSNTGGTGAAGASHISEAQQHARRTSFSAGRALNEKKRLSIGQNSSLLKTPISSALRKSEDKQPIKTNKEMFVRKMTGKASAIPEPFSNTDGQSKPLHKDPYKPNTPPALPLPPSVTNLVNLATNKAPLKNIIDEKEIIVISTHLFREPESETRSMRFDSVKQVVDVIKNSPEGTQTEIMYVEKSMASVTVNEGVQTNTESVEQHRQEVSANSKTKLNSCMCMCALCCRRDHRLAIIDPDANIISIQNQGDVINLKLNIEVRKIVRPVYSCQKNDFRSRSLTNIPRSEKESEISIDNGTVVRPKSSLQLIHHHHGGQGYEGSPKVMVVQCADCGSLNYPPPCDHPPGCDNNKKYLVLLANSVNEDVDECCNYNPPCRPCDLRQSQLKKISSIPIKQTLSGMNFDNFTTVTVSAVPLQTREMVKKTDTACQTEEPQGECMMTKRTVSILEGSGTRCHFQKENSSSISVTTQVDDVETKHSCRKLCPQKSEHENSQVGSEFCPPVASCQKVQSICLQVSSEGSPQVHSTGCQKTALQDQPQGCKPVSPTRSPYCPNPLPYIQVQTQVFPQVPQVADAQTQTHWNSVVLQARIHPDGRYSFHLPPLNVLNSYPF